MYASLREFVEALDRGGELRRVRDPMSAVLEIGGAADLESKRDAPRPPAEHACRTDPRFHASGGKALLMEHAGSEVPVLINAFGSYRRVEMAFGCEGDGIGSIAARIAELVKPQPPRSLGEALAKARLFAPLLKIAPKRKRGRGPCQEIILRGSDVDLTKLPIIKCWPLDGDFEAVGYPAGVNDGIDGLGHPRIPPEQWDAEYRGRYITFAGIHTIHADGRHAARAASHNIGMYRAQLLGKNKLAMHWHMHHDGAAHWRSWKRLGEPMPVAIVLGGESVLPYAATAPLPPGISELLMAGFLNGRGIPLVRAVTVPLWVPANAEIVIEGYVSTEAGYPGWDPRDELAGPLGPGAVFEGPFGDHTGFYSMPDRYPITDVTAITRRRDAIYPTTVVGLPPQEDYFLGKATERLFLPLLKVLIPDIEDYDLPMFGAFHNCAVVAIRKQYPLHARRVMHAIWGAGQMAWTKCIFVVEAEEDGNEAGVNPHDTRAVLEACARWCDPARDIELVRGPLDILDHAAPHLGAGSKIGFDCTRRVEGEQAGSVVRGAEITVAAELRPTGEELAAVRSVPGVLDAAVPGLAPGWLVVRADKGYGDTDRPHLGRRIARSILDLPASDVPRFAVVVGRDVEPCDGDQAFFHWLANMDPGRDMLRDVRRVVFDSTPKAPGDAANGEPVRPWPPIIASMSG